MAEASPMSLLELEKDPRLFLYTSLTAGSSHIITATSRLETILKANKIPFQAIDMATDEKARRLWQRRAGGRKLPGLVKEGFVIGDLAEVEEWNEFGELKENIGPVPAHNAAAPSGGQTGVNIAPPSRFASSAVPSSSAPGSTNTTGVYGQTAVPAAKIPEAGFDRTKGYALPGAAEIAARAAKALETAKAAVTSESSKTGDSAVSTTKSKDTAGEAEKEKTGGIPVPQRKMSISFADGTAEPRSPSSNSTNAALVEKKAAEKASAPSTTSATTEKPEAPGTIDSAIKPSADITVATSTGKAQDVALSAPIAVKSPDSAKSPETVASPASTHRGSEIKEAPAEVIREVEKSLTLKESKDEEAAAEAEDEEESGKESTPAVAAQESKASVPEVTEEKETTRAKDVEEKLKTLDVKDAKTSMAATPASAAADSEAQTKKTQEQDPKEAADASKSVED